MNTLIARKNYLAQLSLWREKEMIVENLLFLNSMSKSLNRIMCQANKSFSSTWRMKTTQIF